MEHYTQNTSHNKPAQQGKKRNEKGTELAQTEACQEQEILKWRSHTKYISSDSAHYSVRSYFSLKNKPTLVIYLNDTEADQIHQYCFYMIQSTFTLEWGFFWLWLQLNSMSILLECRNVLANSRKNLLLQISSAIWPAQIICRWEMRTFDVHLFS